MHVGMLPLFPHGCAARSLALGMSRRRPHALPPPSPSLHPQNEFGDVEVDAEVARASNIAVKVRQGGGGRPLPPPVWLHCL